jgi:hypothetical protein
VKIFVPGDPTTVVDTFVREDHKVRFPLHWAHYQNKHGGDPKEIGTPLSHWPRLQPSQVEELRALKFYTVEAVAGASDAQLQRIGMVAGMSPYAFRDAAVRFLALAKDDSKAAEVEARAKALEEENKKLREDSEKAMAEMRARCKPSRMRSLRRKPEGQARAPEEGARSETRRLQLRHALNGTALQLVQQAMLELGLPSPSVVVSEHRRQVKQFLALLNASGYEMCRQHQWEALNKQYIVTTSSTTLVGNTTLGSSTVSGIASTAGIDTTYQISGTGINQATFVSAVPSG